MFHNNPEDDLGPLFTPAERRSRRAFPQSPTCLRAFWLKPVSLFGLFTITMLASVHLVLTLSSDSSAAPG